MPEERTDEAYLKREAKNQKNENDYISSRWSQLYELEKEWGTLAVKYIILLNSGGAVATLGFIGSVGAANVPQQAKWALLFFRFRHSAWRHNYRSRKSHNTRSLQ